MGLRILTLNLAHCPILSSQTTLPLLDAVQIVCALGITTAPFQLTWLHAQPYTRLEISVYILSFAAAQHVQALTHIQQLRAQTVHIHCMCPPTAAMQHVWQDSWIPALVHIHIRSQVEGMIAFPDCPFLIVDARQTLEPLPLTWEALTRRPCAIQIRPSSGAGLSVTGHPGGSQVPSSGTMYPWLLSVVHACAPGDVSFAGLPASQPCRGWAAYLLRNAAAEAAGLS